MGIFLLHKLFLLIHFLVAFNILLKKRIWSMTISIIKTGLRCEIINKIISSRRADVARTVFSKLISTIRDQGLVPAGVVMLSNGDST